MAEEEASADAAASPGIAEEPSASDAAVVGDLAPHSLADLSRLHGKDPSRLSERRTSFYGWVRRVREGGGGTLVFLDLYDGTKVGSLNCVASAEEYGKEEGEGEEAKKELEATTATTQDEKSFKTLTYAQLSQTEHLSLGCAVVVDGTLVLSPPTATQDFELQVSRVRVIGGVDDPLSYPIQKGTEKKMTSLRQLPFFRIRSQVVQCLFRIRSKLSLGVHLFMDSEDVQLTDPNVITVSDCEGAGETFTISPSSLFQKEGQVEEGVAPPVVGLTVSSQLPLEATVLGFKQVYTCQKSFRAEKSDTAKHLAEFTHVEYEGAFLTMDDLLNQAERFVKYVVNYAFDRCKADFDFLESKLAPTDLRPTRSLLRTALSRPFVRIKHRDAIELIRKLVKEKAKLPDDNGKMKRVKVDKFPDYGDDLSSEHEKLLVKYFGYTAIPEGEREERVKAKEEFGAFVFVTHWPLKIKSFYMAQLDDGSGECLSFDLLSPRAGELFGGSMREWRHDVLAAEIERRGMDVAPIQWFVDLRKAGSVPHGGWGMGFDRLCMLVCGVQSVRDVVPFPVYYTHCPY